MSYIQALNFCKKQRATLPLPLSLLEFEVFYNFSGPNKAWIGISDPLSGRKKQSWTEFINNQPVYIKLRVNIFIKVYLVINQASCLDIFSLLTLCIFCWDLLMVRVCCKLEVITRTYACMIVTWH